MKPPPAFSPAPAIPAVIRPATVADLAAINEIYNHYVLTCTCTFQIAPESAAARRAWFRGHGPGYPVLVAELADGNIAGWGALGPYKEREGWRFTVENSVYVRAGMHGRGLGRALLAELVSRGRAAGHWNVIAVICAEQESSIRLHTAAGFVEVGRLPGVGCKFDRRLDVVYMQLQLDAGR